MFENLGIFQPILIFLMVLLFVDFLLFLRALSLNEMSIKSIFKTILKVDASFILAAAFIAFLANFINIIQFFMK